MKNICSIGWISPMPTASQVYRQSIKLVQRMPTASQVYSIGVANNVYDPCGVADGECLCFSTNLVSLRDMKNIGIEI